MAIIQKLRSKDPGHVVNVLLRRFITYKVLWRAYGAVARAEKAGKEGEGQFEERLFMSARL